MVSTHHTCQQLQQRRSALVPLAALVLLLVAPTPCRAAATVEHSFNSGASWQPAGSIHLQSDEEPAATYERAWGQPQLAALQGLVETDGLYLWRVSLGGAGGLAPVLTSIKAACLAAALTDPELVLQLDAAGRIVSAQISVPASAAPGGSCSVSHALAALKGLSAAQLEAASLLKVAVHSPGQGPDVPRGPPGVEVPDLMAAAGAQQAAAAAAAAAQRQRQQQQAGGQAAGDGSGDGAGERSTAPPPVDNRTWLQKNWLIVLCGLTMVLNIVMRGLAPEEQGPPHGPPGAQPPARAAGGGDAGGARARPAGQRRA